jgi:hypothetical protein
MRVRGLLVGSEESSEFGLAELGWMECRHQRVEGVGGGTPPIWGLVYHDCVAMGRYGNAWMSGGVSAWAGGVGGGGAKAGAAPGWATEMLWGYYVLMSLGEHWSAEKEKVLAAVRSTRHVDEHFARISTAEMVNHRYLTPDGEVERTEWSSGQAVTVNFGHEPVKVEGMELRPGEVRSE